MEVASADMEAQWAPGALDSKAPIYLAIADAIDTDVDSGRLRPGKRLPTHRALARRLGVNVMTVSRAYAEAHMGLEQTKHIGRIVIHPRDPDIVYVAAVGDLWGPNPERGVYKTSDGGETWALALHIDDHTGAIDLALDPGDANTLFAAMYQRQRTGWGFNGGGLRPEASRWRRKTR